MDDPDYPIDKFLDWLDRNDWWLVPLVLVVFTGAINLFAE